MYIWNIHEETDKYLHYHPKHSLLVDSSQKSFLPYKVPGYKQMEQTKHSSLICVSIAHFVQTNVSHSQNCNYLCPFSVVSFKSQTLHVFSVLERCKTQSEPNKWMNSLINAKNTAVVNKIKNDNKGNDICLVIFRQALP